MGQRFQSRGWRIFRRVFRAFRIALLLVVLLVVAVGAYLNEVGLPDFLKRPLLEKLRAHGVEIQFTRLRLRWYRGVVAENVSFGRAQSDTNAPGPRFQTSEVQLRLNHASLFKLQFNVDSLILRDGRFVWLLPETNQPIARLMATNIQAQLRFLPNDQWELDHLTGSFAGAKLQLTGSVSNISQLRDWSVFHRAPGAAPGNVELQLRELADTIDRLKFAAPPELNVQFRGDGSDPRTFSALVTLRAPQADTPWGTFTNGTLISRLTAPTAETSREHLDFELRTSAAKTPWGSGANLRLHLDLLPDKLDTNLVHARLEATADRPVTPWAQAAAANVSAAWDQRMTNAIPQSGNIEAHLTAANTKWGAAATATINARMTTPDNPTHQADESWAWWAMLEPYGIEWNCRLKDIHVQDLQAGAYDVQSFTCGGFWDAPKLTITNLQSELYQGGVEFRAALDVPTRSLAFDGAANFDIQKFAPLLNEVGRRWLAQYSWDVPPNGHALGRVTLPDWTNRSPDWHGEVQPTLWLNGELEAGSAAFHGVPVNSAKFHFSYSNMVWELPDLVATRPEGTLEMAQEADDRTQTYHMRLHSTMDITVARDLLDAQGRRAMDFLKFDQPPVIDAEIWGHWHDQDQTGVKAVVAATNFSVRDEKITSFQGKVEYTNGFVLLTDGRIDRGDEFMTASALGVDIAGRRAFLTNGFSTMAGGPFFHVVGPKVAEVMEPYRFLKPPSVHADGVIPLSDDETVADLHFKVDGGPFTWMKMNADHVSGWVDWTGKHLKVDVEQASFYGGNLTATASFDFSPRDGADFTTSVTTDNADLQPLMRDVYSGTNHLEGRLTARLDNLHGNTTDMKTWAGTGAMELRNGLIWEIPIFGFLSPILDRIPPGGLGESRADRATATFTLTNGYIKSDNLEIRAGQAVQVLYRGTVSFGGDVDAVVQARLLQGLPLVGTVVATVLLPVTLLTEFKVTGTLSNPKKEQTLPLRLPFMLLKPFESIKDIGPGASAESPKKSP